MPTLDHFALGAADLNLACEELADLTGVTPAMGGAHVGLGTRNALLAFAASEGAAKASDVYLEIIAPDEAQFEEGKPTGLGQWLSELSEHTPLHWAIRSVDLNVAAQAARQVGFAPRPIRDTTRQQPSGGSLSWRLMGIGGHDQGGLMPFYIDWMDCPHPARNNPVVGALTAFEIATPSAPMRELLASTDGVSVKVAAQPSLSITFATQRAPVTYQADQLHGFQF